MIKKDIPLSVLKLLTPSNKDLKFIEVVEDNNTIMLLKDKDSSSSFYFKIVRKAKTVSGIIYNVEYKPTSTEELNPFNTQMSIERISTQLANWLKIIGQFNDVKTIFDDPIIEAYTAEIFEEYSVDDPEADFYPFSIQHQEVLLKYLSTAVLQIHDFGEKLDGKKKTVNDNIEVEIQEFKESLTQLSKNDTLIVLSGILAKIRKHSYDLYQLVSSNFVIEKIKKLLK